MCVFRISASDHILGYKYVRPQRLHRSDEDATSASAAWPVAQAPFAHRGNIAQCTSVDRSASLLYTGGNTAVARQCLGDKPSSWYYDHSDTKSEPGTYTHHMGRCDRLSHMDVHMAKAYHMLQDNEELGPRTTFVERIPVFPSTASFHKDNQVPHRAT